MFLTLTVSIQVVFLIKVHSVKFCIHRNSKQCTWLCSIATFLRNFLSFKCNGYIMRFFPFNSTDYEDFKMVQTGITSSVLLYNIYKKKIKIIILINKNVIASITCADLHKLTLTHTEKNIIKEHNKKWPLFHRLQIVKLALAIIMHQ